jgi:hypothetical protein
VILFSVVLIVPLLFVLLAFFLSKKIVWQELLLIIGAQAIVAAAAAGICYSSNISDTETWNGSVTRKRQVEVSCSHSYSCNCRESCSGSGKNQSCSTVCDTCYEHTNDWDWRVWFSTGSEVNVERVDRRGSDMPDRYNRVVIGEPIAETRSYDNYVKASPDSLFRHQGLAQKYAASLPAYPGHVYDYYRLDRIVQVGTQVPDLPQWNLDLARLNAELGAPRQVNVIVVLVQHQPDDWYDALEEKWIGGKKNDVVLVVSLDRERKPEWARVMAWTVNPIFKVKLRDQIMAAPILERWTVMEALRSTIVAYHHRKPMADFQYLAASITPTGTEWTVTLLLGFLVAAGLTWLFQVNDFFENPYR